jgi:hypothetical protein
MKPVGEYRTCQGMWNLSGNVELVWEYGTCQRMWHLSIICKLKSIEATRKPRSNENGAFLTGQPLIHLTRKPLVQRNPTGNQRGPTPPPPPPGNVKPSLLLRQFLFSQCIYLRSAGTFILSRLRTHLSPQNLPTNTAIPTCVTGPSIIATALPGEPTALTSI